MQETLHPLHGLVDFIEVMNQRTIRQTHGLFEGFAEAPAGDHDDAGVLQDPAGELGTFLAGFYHGVESALGSQTRQLEMGFDGLDGALGCGLVELGGLLDVGFDAVVGDAGFDVIDQGHLVQAVRAEDAGTLHGLQGLDDGDRGLDPAESASQAAAPFGIGMDGEVVVTGAPGEILGRVVTPRPGPCRQSR